MSDLSPVERWAQRCVENALPGSIVTQHDDGSAPSMYDLALYVDGVQRGAIEVTSAVDQRSLVTWNLMNGGEGRWIVPSLRGGWFVNLLPHARAKRVWAELPALLAELEANGVTDVDARPWSTGHGVDVARALKVSTARQGATNFPGSIYVSLDRDHSLTSGFVAAEHGDALSAWLSEWANDAQNADNRGKLASSGARERHLFTIVAPFTLAPFAVTDLLMRADAPLPTTPPQLPKEITHLWVLGAMTSGRGVRWDPLVGWGHFARLTDAVAP
jgi:hypothetical protein